MRKIRKPWGFELVWAEGGAYVGKILEIKKGHRLSKQYHRKKHETIYVLSGKLLVMIGQFKDDKASVILKPGQTLDLPPWTIHRFCAPYNAVKLAEVSTPEVYDVIRLEDDYKRK